MSAAGANPEPTELRLPVSGAAGHRRGGMPWLPNWLWRMSYEGEGARPDP